MSDVRIEKMVERVLIVCGPRGLRTACRAKVLGSLPRVSSLRVAKQRDTVHTLSVLLCTLSMTTCLC